jgi:hypothetical protein
VRLLLADPNTRHEYLKGLFDQRLGQIQSATGRHDRVFSAKQERIIAFIKDRVTDQTTAQELREMLQLLDEANAPSPVGERPFEVLSPPPALPPSASPRPRDAGSRFQVIRQSPNTPAPGQVRSRLCSARCRNRKTGAGAVSPKVLSFGDLRFLKQAAKLSPAIRPGRFFPGS